MTPAKWNFASIGVGKYELGNEKKTLLALVLTPCLFPVVRSIEDLHEGTKARRHEGGKGMEMLFLARSRVAVGNTREDDAPSQSLFLRAFVASCLRVKLLWNERQGKCRA